jgi:Fibronectin type III domain/Planctomycete cytochrome C
LSLFGSKNRRILLTSFIGIFCALSLFQNCSPLQGQNNSQSAQSSTISDALPSTASQLTAQSVSSTQVNLTWVAGANDTGYNVQRAGVSAGVPGTFSTIAQIGPSTTSYSDTTLLPSTNYYYQIVSTNGVLLSLPTSYVEVTTMAGSAMAPATPTDLTATATAATLVTISWQATTTGVANFELDRSTDGTTFTIIAEVSSNTKTYDDYNLNPQTMYYYRVRAMGASANSPFTANATTTTLAAVNTNTYTYVSLNVIGPNCVSCHNAGQASGGYDLSTYSGVLNSVTAGQATNSELYKAYTTGGMPPGSPLTSTQQSQITSWINDGALNN